MEGLRRKVFRFLWELLDIYSNKRVSRGAAALSYFLMLSIFPMLICVHAILVRVVPGMQFTFEDFQGVIPESALTVILDYLQYVSLHNNSTMATAGVIGTLTTSAAAYRTLSGVMEDIQGGSRFKGIFQFIFSFAFSILFVLSIYFAALVMVTGNWLMNHLANAIPVLSGIALWQTLKYPVLLVIFIFIIYGLYKLTAPRGTKGTVLPGAVLAALALVLVSYLFSMFISMSTRYPLLYGSLASIIIVMVWLYFCGVILIMANAINCVVRKMKADKDN